MGEETLWRQKIGHKENLKMEFRKKKLKSENGISKKKIIMEIKMLRVIYYIFVIVSQDKKEKVKKGEERSPSKCPN